jgi:uncharacterized membrane protein YhdT
MRRTLWMSVSLLLIAGWLILAYAPGIVPSMPTIGWPAWSHTLLALLAGVGALLFVAIQAWIVWATDRSLVASSKVAAEFGLNRGVEAVLTALPLIFTVLLIGGYLLLQPPA